MLKRTLAAASSAEQPLSQPQGYVPTRPVPISDEQSPPPPPPPPMGYENYWQASQFNSPQIIGMDGVNGVLPPLPPDLGQSGLPTISWLCSCNLCIESVQQFIAALNNSNGVYAACVSSAGPVYNELLSSSNIQMQPPPQIYTGVNGNPTGNVENISVASIGIGSENASFSVKIEANRDDGTQLGDGDHSNGLKEDLPADDEGVGLNGSGPDAEVEVNGFPHKDFEGESSDDSPTDGGSSEVPATSTSVEDSVDSVSTTSFFWGNGSTDWVSPDSCSGGEENGSAMEGRHCFPKNYSSNLESTDNSNQTDGDDDEGELPRPPPPQRDNAPKSSEEISENSSSSATNSDEPSPLPISPPPMGYDDDGYDFMCRQASQFKSRQFIEMEDVNEVLPLLPPDMGQSELPTITWLCSCNLCIESVQQFLAALNNSDGVYAACVSSAGPVYNELLSSSIGIEGESTSFSGKIEAYQDYGTQMWDENYSNGLNEFLPVHDEGVGLNGIESVE